MLKSSANAKMLPGLAVIVSAIAYHSKVSFMVRLPSIDSKLISLFNSFGTTFSDISYAGEKIFLSMYDLINSCNNLTYLRYTKFPKAIAKTNQKEYHLRIKQLVFICKSCNEQI